MVIFISMQDSSKAVVLDFIKKCKPATVLDAPSGDGWLSKGLSNAAIVDGIDLFESAVTGYRSIYNTDLDYGIPKHLPRYEAILCCEGLEHFGNPLFFLNSTKDHLEGKSLLVITTPNIWYPAARIQYLLRGFFPSFPSLAGKIIRGSHMHIMPWSFPQLYLYLKLAGFDNIEIHAEPLSKPKHLWERLIAFPQIFYCRSRLKKAQKKGNTEEAGFWALAGSNPSVFGRHLIVSEYLS